jgi:CheY-specific phosphatase CheX
MNKEKLMTAMQTSISEVLETMFFLPVDFLGPSESPCKGLNDETVVAAKLGFDGPASGIFRLLVPENLARLISADFLGIDPAEMTAEDVAGTVKEMINMLAGNTFSIYDADTVFDLMVPEMEAAGATQARYVGGDSTITIDIDTLENRMVLELAINA